MKNTWKNIVVILAVLGVLLVASAQAAVSVYAEEVEPSSNVVATTGAPAESNAPAATQGDKKLSHDADHPPVRIDETGIHVGGPNPVDINAPGIAHGHGEFATRVLQNLTGMLAIMGTFGMPVALLLIIFYFKHRRNRMAHETLRAMIDKGMPITPELVAQDQGQGLRQFRPVAGRAAAFCRV